MGGPSKQTETTMATIGTFIVSENGFAGMIKTLSLSIKVKLDDPSRRRSTPRWSRSTAGTILR